jgi:anti-sigma regulatory factor (Ser/Thr protein kinase)
VFYRGLDDLASTTVPYIQDGLERREPVLVAALPDRIRTLRSALGEDAEQVDFLDMAEVGGNPARIIPVWREFVRDSVGAGSGRGIGEPVWSTRRHVEIEECRLHESLLNVAFDDGPPWQLLCPYDVDSLPAEVVEDAMRTHPLVDSAAHSDVAYGGHTYAKAGFAFPLSPVPPSAYRLSFGEEDLGEVRSSVRTWSLAAGMSEDAASHLVLAVHEVATNSVCHGGGSGLLNAWSEPDAFVVEVADEGFIANPLVGRDLATDFADVAESGRGVWIVNQLCDLVQIRSLETGTQVRLHSWL